MKKKIKLKRKYRIVFSLILIIIISVFGLSVFTRKDNNNEDKKGVNLVEVISDKLKDYNISSDFISYVNSNYKDSLSKLLKLLDKNTYDVSMWHKVTGNSYIVLNDLYNKKYETQDNVKIIKDGNNILSFVGDISFADNWRIIPKYDERGKGINGVLSDDILKIMRDSSLMVANSEFTVSNRGTPIPSKLYTFRAKPERLPIYNEMGVDLVTLANNHVYDYGKDAFLDMLDAFNEYKIPYIGAGKNIDEAKKPYYFIINGYKFSFVNASRAEKYRLTPGAKDDSEGIFLCYDPTDMINLIKEEKKNSDYVITIIHFGKEDSHELEDEQVSSARNYIDAGSDAVIGHHAHTLQGVEIYNSKPIIYNLGNFLFNQATVDTAIFQMVLDDNGSFDYYMIPALQKDCFTDTASGDLKQRIINDLNSWSINAYISEDGKINKKN